MLIMRMGNKMFADLIELTGMCASLDPVGSRVTCNPAPTDTDEDYLMLRPNAHAFLWLEANGFVTTTDDNYNGIKSDFASYKYGDVNIIITLDDGFYTAFMAATHVCKRLNLLNKQDRIALFQAVLYRNQYEGRE